MSYLEGLKIALDSLTPVYWIILFSLANTIKLSFVSPRKKKKRKVKVAQSCPTLCDPMDYTVHEILQARMLEWIAFPFSRGSFQPRDQTQEVSRIAG